MIYIGLNSPSYGCRSASLAAGLFAVAFAAFPPSIGHAACKEWKLDQFEVIQTNGIFVRIYPAQQGGGQFGGGARYYFRDSEGVYDSVPGQVEGNISGEDISFTIHWQNGPVGEYTGHVSPQGFLDGETRDRLNPESKARWSMRAFADSSTMAPAAKCLDVATTPAPPAPPPASPLDKAGVVQKPGMGGDIFKKTTTPPAQAPAGGGGAEYATAITPATIYVEPGGAAFKDANGDDAAMTVGSKALVLEKRANPVWYKVQTKPVGWVWGEDVTLGP